MGPDSRNQQCGWRLGILVLLLLILLAVVIFGVIDSGRGAQSKGEGTVILPQDSVSGMVDSLTDTAAMLRDTGAHDSLTGRRSPISANSGNRRTVQDSVKSHLPVAADTGDTLSAMAAADSSDMTADSMIAADTAAADPCARDTVAPWVYPDPSGGLHRQTTVVKFIANESCRIEWRFAGNESWQTYEQEAVTVEKSATIEYRGVDECGNVMPPRSEYYEISRTVVSSACPAEMEQVRVGGSVFCIDRYEWPNRRAKRPSTFVSLYQAMDSCFSRGKRLCTSDEWKVACAGPYGWTYLYGDRFESRACNTSDTAVAVSGSRPECRGYYEVFDMSGNVLEWTSTRSPANNRFYNVMGGFWESGSQSRCFDTRYSYFPQNRHNPVGFRCCSDTTAAGAEPAGGRRAR